VECVANSEMRLHAAEGELNELMERLASLQDEHQTIESRYAVAVRDDALRRIRNEEHQQRALQRAEQQVQSQYDRQ
jgi:hypothetical protein